MEGFKKGSRINPKFLGGFVGQTVLVEFDFSGISLMDWEEEHDKTISDLRESHPDGLFHVIEQYDSHSLLRLNADGTPSDNLPYSKNHNLISGIYARDEDEQE